MERFSERELLLENVYFHQDRTVRFETFQTHDRLGQSVYAYDRAAFFGYMIPFAFSYMMSAVHSGQLSPACHLPMWIVQAAPVSISLGMASMLPSVFDPSFTVGAKYLIRAMFSGLDSFPLLAVPMFVLSGILMAKGGISKRLFDVFAYFLGNFTAGLPCAVIVTCLFYGAISGSGPATVAAVGSMTIPILISLGYELSFAASIAAVAGGLGVINPPSIPFIMFGMASDASVSDLFLAGIVPG